ncbi:MAG: hypothetical protein GY931_15565 [Maribacter sp.]|nr:hypothetical protein [Maribacter sp.]
MKNSLNKDLKIFKGAGWLFAFALAIVGAIVVFTLSNNFAAAISGAIPIGVAMGMGLEQKFQQKTEPVNPQKTKRMVGLLSLGILIFVAFYFFVTYN